MAAMTVIPRTQTIEVAEVFRSSGDFLLRNRSSLTATHVRAFRAICDCRTAALGGHVDRCDTCATERISYNSCRNRHCPKCGALRRERWVVDRRRDLPPVPYFHVVFTLPAELRALVWQNQKLLFNLLFRSVSRTLSQAGANPRLLGGRIGFVAILHTWGQSLTAHPHIHCIVTGGVLTDGKWKPARENYLLPVAVLSRLFRGKFMAGLRELRAALELQGSLAHLQDAAGFAAFTSQLYAKHWVVYCKSPFRTPDILLRYLGRYTHRVAIANARLLDFDGTHVRFRYRDYSRGNCMRIMQLHREEFIRRFLLHVLPHRFVRIRYYGTLANRNRRTVTALCCSQLRSPRIPPAGHPDWKLLIRTLTGLDVDRCPVCLVGAMIYMGKFQRRPNPP